MSGVCSLFRRIVFRDGSVVNVLVDVFEREDEAFAAAKSLSSQVELLSGCSLVHVSGKSGEDTGMVFADALSFLGLEEVSYSVAKCEVSGSLLQPLRKALILPS